MASLDREFPMGWYVDKFKTYGHPINCRWCGDALLVVNKVARVCRLCDAPDKSEAKRGR